MSDSISSSQSPHLQWLYARINYEQQASVSADAFRLANITELLARLDNPHLASQVVHVAGTKGKGSVSTMVANILSASKLKTGVYTSPHLISIHQRMAIDGVPISDQRLQEILGLIRPVVETMDQERTTATDPLRALTFFEITTTAAFLYFALEKCDYVVFEVGLGGRLDSTNVCQPQVCCITNISIDHTRQLGDTEDLIAFEKAGIIKTGIPVVSGALHPLAAAVIADISQQRNAPLCLLGTDFQVEATETEETHASQASPQFSVSGQRIESNHSAQYQHDNLSLRLLGPHQQTNAALAVAIVETINSLNQDSSQFETIRAETIRTGLRKTVLAGRTEMISDNPTVIADMAHNVASMEALTVSLQQHLPQWRTAVQKTVVLAFSQEKDIPGMLQFLVDAGFGTFILTQYHRNPRAVPLDELVSLCESVIHRQSLSTPPQILTAPNPAAAQRLALQGTAPDSVVCFTGSVFLLAELDFQTH